MEQHFYMLVASVVIVVIILLAFILITRNKMQTNPLQERRNIERRQSNYERRVNDAFESLEYFEERRKMDRRKSRRRDEDTIEEL